MRIRAFKVVDGGGKEFFAAFPFQPGTPVVVLTNRDGAWKRDDDLLAADLLFPEQDLADWDVREIAQTELPGIPADLL